MNDLENYIFPPELKKFFKDFKTAPKSQKNALQEHLKRFPKAERRQESFAWILAKSGLPWLELDIRPPYEKMLEEARRLRPLYVGHRSDKGDKGYAGIGWRALCIHGIDPEKTYDYRTYGYKSEGDVPYRWTEIAKLAPVTTNYFKKLYPCKKYFRLRFSLLEPGGYILPHTDRHNSFLWEVNLALNHPEGCFFKMEGRGYVPQKPKKAFILDVAPQHAVVNTSKEDRFHIIVHGEPTHDPRFQKMIVKSYQKLLTKK